MDEDIEYLIMKFVEKQHMGIPDKMVQAEKVLEEANELKHAAMSRGDFPFADFGTDNEKEEVADVIISALVYAGLSGFLMDVDGLIKEKMKINIEKPVRQGVGTPVRKK